MYKAKLENIEGKYYTTEISVISKNGNKYLINILPFFCNEDIDGEFEPSDRELNSIELTREEYNLLELDEKMFNDNHYERNSVYNLANYIIDKINS